jgi:hypothetical protein
MHPWRKDRRNWGVSLTMLGVFRCQFRALVKKNSIVIGNHWLVSAFALVLWVRERLTSSQLNILRCFVLPAGEFERGSYLRCPDWSGQPTHYSLRTCSRSFLNPTTCVLHCPRLTNIDRTHSSGSEHPSPSLHSQIHGPPTQSTTSMPLPPLLLASRISSPRSSLRPTSPRPNSRGSNRLPLATRSSAYVRATSRSSPSALPCLCLTMSLPTLKTPVR